MTISRKDFEKAYKKVFGKDRDLSELSDIKLSDFKEVLQVAVEEFDKTAPPEPEECRDIVYILWRVYKTVHEILQYYSKEEAIVVIEGEIFYDFNNRSEAIRGIKYEYDGFANRLNQPEEFLIIKDGYNKTSTKYAILIKKILLYIIGIPWKLLLLLHWCWLYIAVTLGRTFDSYFKDKDTFKNELIALFDLKAQLGRRATVFHKNQIAIPLYNQQDIKILLAYICSYWDDNYTHLKNTGYSKTIFCRLHDYRDMLHILYPTRVLSNIDVLSHFKSCDLSCAHYWKDGESPSYPNNENNYSPENNYFKKAISKLKNYKLPKGFRNKNDYEYAPGIQDFSAVIRNNLEKQRVWIYLAFEGVIKELYHCSIMQDEDHVFEKSVKLICDQLSHVTETCLLLDKYYNNDSKYYAPEKNEYREIGLLKFFEFIVYCCMGINSLQYSSVRNDLAPIIETDGYGLPKLKIASYAEVYDNLSNVGCVDCIAYIDAALSNILDTELESDLMSLWESHYELINLHLQMYNQEFDKDLALKNPFMPFLDKVRNNIKSNYKKVDLFPAGGKEYKTVEAKKKSTIIGEHLSSASIIMPDKITWEDICLDIRNNSIVAIIISEDKADGRDLEYEVPVEESGFWDTKSKVTDTQFLLLRMLIFNSGRLDFPIHLEERLAKGSNDKFAKDTIKTINAINSHPAAYISKLRKALKATFPINGNPVKKEGRNYCARFLIASNVEQLERLKSRFFVVNNWTNVSITELEDGLIEVQYVPDVGVALDSEERIIDKSQFEGKSCNESFTFKELGLWNNNEEHISLAGVLLLEILRNSGKIDLKKLPENSRFSGYSNARLTTILLRLNEQLNKIFDCDQYPFEFEGSSTLKSNFFARSKTIKK